MYQVVIDTNVLVYAAVGAGKDEPKKKNDSKKKKQKKKKFFFW